MVTLHKITINHTLPLHEDARESIALAYIIGRGFSHPERILSYLMCSGDVITWPYGTYGQEPPTLQGFLDELELDIQFMVKSREQDAHTRILRS